MVVATLKRRFILTPSIGGITMGRTLSTSALKHALLSSRSMLRVHGEQALDFLQVRHEDIVYKSCQSAFQICAFNAPGPGH
jgi:hypothetical protein